MVRVGVVGFKVVSLQSVFVLFASVVSLSVCLVCLLLLFVGLPV